MDRAHFYERDYYGTTFLHPLAAASMILLGIMTLALPRKYALLPLLLLINFIPCSQRIAIAGLDFNLLRIMIIFGWTRILMRGEFKDMGLVKLDKLMLAWAASETLIYVLQFKNFGALVTMSGRMMEAVGGYFMVRAFVRSWADLKALAQCICIISIPVAIFFVIEKNTGRNYFSIFGGVPEYTHEREGKLRAMGAIANPILAGCMWGAFLPLMAALLWQKGSQFLGAWGVLNGLVVVVACASSTPLASVMAAGLGGFLFLHRRKMHEIRKAIIWGSIGMHLLMETQGHPLWHLLARIDLVGGSTGWHRYNLINQWIHRFWEWALLGTKTTAHWGWGLWDVTNQFVLESVRGGLLTLIVFVWMIGTAFRYVGPLWRWTEGNRAEVAMAWALGCSLFAHISSFIAVSYFGQMVIVFYMQIALIAGLYAAMKRAQAEGTEEVREEGETAEVASVPYRRRRPLLGA
ncbi:MAG TPA: hypothetical protein ENJ09_03390 [Planctomycetes bacterium]|nr:hypothetical protein [Planctomycetota bacterium]